VFPARVLDSGIMTTRVTLELQSIGFPKLMQFFRIRGHKRDTIGQRLVGEVE